MFKTKALVALIAILLLTGACNRQPQQGSTPDPEPPVVSSEPADEAPQGGVILSVSEDISVDDASFTYTITNDSGEPVHVVLAPQFERKDGEEWTPFLLTGVGFCGVPDTITESYSAEIPLEWLGEELIPGEFRLSFVLSDSQQRDTGERLSTAFTIADA